MPPKKRFAPSVPTPSNLEQDDAAMIECDVQVGKSEEEPSPSRGRREVISVPMASMDTPIDTPRESGDSNRFSSFIDGLSSDSDEVEDEVVQRLPVFFSQKLDSLFLMQYPTKQRDFPEGHHPTKGRIKPKSQVLELEVPLMTSTNYSFARSEEMSRQYSLQIQNQSQSKRGQRVEPSMLPLGMPENGHLESQVFASTPIPMSANYVVGIIQNGQVHLSPLHGNLNMRPTLAYLDREKDKKPKPTRKDEDEEMEEVDQGRIVQLQVKKQDLDGPSKETAARIAQHSMLVRQAEEEPWMAATLELAGSEMSQRMAKGLIGDMDSDPPTHITTPTDYLNDLAPHVTLDKKKKVDSTKSQAYHVTKGLTWSEIRPLPITAQIKALLINANILPWRRIRELIDDGHSDLAILEQLLVVGTLVQGNWTIKSSLIYSGRAQHARSILLQLFNEHRHVKRDQFISQTLLPLEMATNMLKEIAVWELDHQVRGRSLSFGSIHEDTPRTGHWVLRVPRDVEFARMHADIVRRAEESFNAEKVQALHALQAIQSVAKKPTQRGKHSAPTSEPPVAAMQSPPPGIVHLSSSSTAAAESKSKKPVIPMYQLSARGDSGEEQMRDLLNSMFGKFGVCGRPFIKTTISHRINDYGTSLRKHG
jgi:DNA-directed RNA polymerase-3 subunit RPC5